MSDVEASVLSLYSVSQFLLGTHSRDLLAQSYLEELVLNGLVVEDVIIALEPLTIEAYVQSIRVRITFEFTLLTVCI